MGTFYVYILATKKDGVLYVGAARDLAQRVQAHKLKAVRGFTTKYGADRLVWFERHETLGDALARERRLKRWRRGWKIALIEAGNPEWNDLATTLAP